MTFMHKKQLFYTNKVFSHPQKKEKKSIFTVGFSLINGEQ